MRHYQQLLDFMVERHRIYIHRIVEKLPPVWTEDKILQRFRFCNVYRELDTVTAWIRENIREPFADNPNLWFMLCMARQINWPETLAELIADKKGAWPETEWKWQRCRDVMMQRKERGEKVYSNAYMLTCVWPDDYTGSRDKPVYTTQCILQPLWKNRRTIQPQMGTSLQQAVETLAVYFGWGHFTAYEVACDLRWTHYLDNAPDKMTWANAGPGAKRGLNRVLGIDLQTPMKEDYAVDVMTKILHKLQRDWPKDWPVLELREVEHSLCEWDKYERARLGQGRPKELFKGSTI